MSFIAEFTLLSFILESMTVHLSRILACQAVSLLRVLHAVWRFVRKRYSGGDAPHTFEKERVQRLGGSDRCFFCCVADNTSQCVAIFLQTRQVEQRNQMR